jgi:hypothetical protein
VPACHRVADYGRRCCIWRFLEERPQDLSLEDRPSQVPGGSRPGGRGGPGRALVRTCGGCKRVDRCTRHLSEQNRRPRRPRFASRSPRRRTSKTRQREASSRSGEARWATRGHRASIPATLTPLTRATMRNRRADSGGRYWARTSDPQLVDTDWAFGSLRPQRARPLVSEVLRLKARAS